MPIRTIRPPVLVLFSLLVAMLGASSSTTLAQTSGYQPVTVSDDSGSQTTFTSAPRRIVSLNAGHTATVFALGVGDRLVAVDSYSNDPPEAEQVQPRLTTYPTVSIETVVALKPDLVLSLVESDDVVAELRHEGIPVLKLFPKTYDAAADQIASLGRVLGVGDRGEQLATTMRRRREAVQQAIGDAPRPRVYYEMDASSPTQPFAAGPNGFYGQLVDLAGGMNIFDELPGDFGQVSAESVVAGDPQLIILADAYQPYSPQTPAMLAARPGWSTISAVQDGAVYAVQEALFASPSPRLADGLETLAYLIHPDRFASTGGAHLVPLGGIAPYCSAGQVPSFTFGLEVLSEILGERMGEPTECAHLDPANGDTYQQTTKGLAIYRQADNTPTFVSGSQHWSLTADGVVQDVPGGR
jgi:iron complex transport system substrate-binding protein